MGRVEETRKNIAEICWCHVPQWISKSFQILKKRRRNYEDFYCSFVEAPLWAKKRIFSVVCNLLLTAEIRIILVGIMEGQPITLTPSLVSPPLSSKCRILTLYNQWSCWDSLRWVLFVKIFRNLNDIHSRFYMDSILHIWHFVWNDTSYIPAF